MDPEPPTATPSSAARRGRDRKVALILAGAGRAGTERHVLGLVRGLRARAVPTLLVTSEPGPLVDAATGLGATWRQVPRSGAMRYVTSLASLLRAERLRVAHTHSGRLASLAARLAGVSIRIDTRHGLPERLRPLYLRHPVWRRWEAVKSRLAHRTLCVCAADARWLEEEARLPRRFLRVVPNGVAIDPAAGSPERRASARRALEIGPEESVLLFVGRLAAQKAPLRILETLAALLRLDRRRKRVRAAICGAGPLESELRAAEERMGLRGSVLWLGEVEDTGPVLAAADLLLLPSEWEGLPYVLLEALAEGTPVLATPVGGVPEVLSGPLATGCVPWSLEAWAAAARGSLEQPTARAIWGREGAAILRRYREEESVRATLDAYRELGWPG